MSGKDWLDEWDVLIGGGNSGAIEEFWLARLEEGVGDGATLLEALKRLRHGGKKTLAATLQELAADEALSEKAWAARRALLREMVRMGHGDLDALRAGLEECIRQVWAGRPSLDRLLAHFKLREARKPLDVLDQLETWLEFDVGGVFLMTGRGPGRVVEANPQLGMLRLDLEREKRVPVPIDAARKYLAPMPAGHFLRRRLEDGKALAAEVLADPPAGLAALLESAGAPQTVSEIKGALVGLVAEDQWTAWWNKAKKNPRLFAAGSGTRVTYRLVAGEEAGDEIRRDFLAAALPQRVELARRHGARHREVGAFMAEQLLAGALASEDPSLAWEALATAGRLGAAPEGLAATRRALLTRTGGPALLEAVGDATQREVVLALLREELPDAWTREYAAWLEHETSPRLLSVMVHVLLDAGQTQVVASFLDRVFLHPQQNPAAFVWACEAAEDEALRDLLDQRLSGSLLVRLVELAERRQLGPYRQRLKEVLSARGLAGRLVQDWLTVDQARRMMQILEHPGEMADERNWLRRAALARFPELRQAPQVEVVPALAGTVTRLQEELRKLLEKEIPETLKAIQVAREHGDLSENFEYHAARARQEFLSARAANIQEDLGRVRIIDPAKADCTRVRVGTRVVLAPVDRGPERRITILGPYEADPDAGVLSNGTEAAQGLLEHVPGDTVNFDGAAWTVAGIEPAI